MPAERWLPVVDVDPSSVPYFSLIVVPGDSLADDPGGRRPSHAPSPSVVEVRAERASKPPRPLQVIGLGPGPDRWLTEEARDALAQVDHVVGYGPYVDRVPQREGLTRHASGNTVEVDRARLALDLASRGERVAVVSGGDAGVFGMASAVFEAAVAMKDEGGPDVPVEVLPGVSAVQAVAAKAGAPIGADFAVVSLSGAVITRRWNQRPLGLVATDTPLHAAPHGRAAGIRTLPSGTALLIEKQQADWVLVRGSGDEQGWLPRASVAQVGE